MCHSSLDQPFHSKRINMGEYPECKNITGATATNLEVNFVSNVKWARAFLLKASIAFHVCIQNWLLCCRTDAEFFVTTGVLCFLYATALIGVYAFADNLYNDNTNAPVIVRKKDFFGHEFYLKLNWVFCIEGLRVHCHLRRILAVRKFRLGQRPVWPQGRSWS